MPSDINVTENPFIIYLYFRLVYTRLYLFRFFRRGGRPGGGDLHRRLLGGGYGGGGGGPIFFTSRDSNFFA